MSFQEAVIAAYRFGADHGNCFVFVVRSADGSHWWDHAPQAQVLEPDSDGEIVWSRGFSDTFEVGDPTEAEWDEWIACNTTV